MVSSTKGETRATVLYTTYTDMVSRVGGTPVVLTPQHPETAPDVVARLDGVILTGGGDVDPALYRGDDDAPIDSLYGIDRERDDYEFALARAAREARVPTLAICRGMQVMNVVAGGSLIEDIVSEEGATTNHRIEGAATTLPQHGVALDPDSAIATALGTATPRVNSLHHQAIRRLGEGLRIVGTSPDGIVEAVEWDGDDWLMWGVQWHPEYLGPDDPPSLALFRSFVEAASR